MIDGFQDLLFHYNYFFEKCVISMTAVNSNKNSILYLVTESPYKVHKYKRFNWHYKKTILSLDFFPINFSENNNTNNNKTPMILIS